MKAFKKSAEALILFLCQEYGNDGEVQKEVYSLLLQNNYTWKLSNAVLHYSLPPQLQSSESRSQESDARRYIRIVENALQSTNAIDHLKQVFRPDSAFWSEHEYDTSTNCSRKVGYFSYLYPLRDRAAVCSVEQIIDYIFSVTCKYFPSVKEAKYAEWWVHTRPHSNGHQLHYDSDETRIESGRSPAHPIASTVLFLSDDIGGKSSVITIVTIIASKTYCSIHIFYPWYFCLSRSNPSNGSGYRRSFGVRWLAVPSQDQ